jgi:hypothetical protein
MTAPRAADEPPRPEARRVRPEESLLQGGVKGVALVTVATAALAGAAALIALVLALLY